jgi:hypothetical protein
VLLLLLLLLLVLLLLVLLLLLLLLLSTLSHTTNPLQPSCKRYAAENYDKYHALLHKRLDAIMRLTNPRKSVMLAIDGPAPLAKLITQRERRKVCSMHYSKGIVALDCFYIQQAAL